MNRARCCLRISSSVPSPAGKSIIPVQKYKTRYPDSSGIDLYNGEEARHKGLYRTHKCDAVLGGTRKMTLSIEPDDGPNWLVESLYVLHPDMKSNSALWVESLYAMHSDMKGISSVCVERLIGFHHDLKVKLANFSR